jgi:hypothetical protein
VIPNNEHNTNSSLADIFKTKNQNMMRKLRSRDNWKSKVRPEKKQKTKEELAEIRKKMMKKRNRSTSPLAKEDDCDNTKDKSSIQAELDPFRGDKHKGKQSKKWKDPPQELLERLAGGKKQIVKFCFNF